MLTTQSYFARYQEVKTLQAVLNCFKSLPKIYKTIGTFFKYCPAKKFHLKFHFFEPILFQIEIFDIIFKKTIIKKSHLKTDKKNGTCEPANKVQKLCLVSLQLANKMKLVHYHFVLLTIYRESNSNLHFIQ